MTLSSVFGKNGVLARGIKGFKERHSQRDLALAVEKTIQQKSALVAEAGTGTGKTFAYLIPAILSEKKTIISTGTKNLQEQLYHRDLPLLLDLLKKPLKKALLKGRANYLCHHRIEFSETRALFDDKGMVEDYFFIKENLPRFETGDISEVGSISEDARIWPYVTSTADNCLGSECPFYEDCFLVKARKKAQSADLIVINHHLFFADSMLKDNGFGDILPHAKVVIFDEAHSLPEIASQFFGKRLSSHQLKLLALDVLREQERIASDDSTLAVLANDVLETQGLFREALGHEMGRRAWKGVSVKKEIKKIMPALTAAILALKERLKLAVERSPVFDKAFMRIQQLEDALIEVTDEKQGGAIHWIETFKRSFSINATPLDVKASFQALLSQETAYIYTSATLSVNDNITHFSSRLGLEKATSLIFQSPFKYEEQTLFYMPRELIETNSRDFTKTMLNAVIPLINALKGKTFLLFTSYRALNEAAKLLAHELDFPLLIQGSMTKSNLLETFREKGNAVLLGTYSFWEGVDVKGQALSLVVIDKLPFESPACPLLQARSDEIRKRGGSPFDEYQLPQAVIALKQGLGRLIRDDDDKGVMVVCDPRLPTRAYGEIFFKSLPMFPKTRDKQVVLSFIENLIDDKATEKVENE
jgi:ATP-dependent DNA helicase DinG